MEVFQSLSVTSKAKVKIENWEGATNVIISVSRLGTFTSVPEICVHSNPIIAPSSS